MPFIKNNPREKELQQIAAAKEAENGVNDQKAPMTEAEFQKMKRQREIEALKRSLMAPLPQIPSQKGAIAVVASNFN